VVDDDGEPIAVVAGASQGSLTPPLTLRPFGLVIEDPIREDHGFLSYLIDRLAITPIHERPRAFETGRKVRPVTFDLSVAIEGFDRSLFGPTDALFISAALELELAFSLGGEIRAGELFKSYATGWWDGGTSIPLDWAVLHVFRQIVPELRPGVFTGSQLDRTDLLCAATAIVYNSPMYTTKPEAYASIKNGLRVIEYGPVRNKKAAKEQESRRRAWEETATPELQERARRVRPPRVPIAPPTNADIEALFAMYMRGAEFDETAQRLLSEANEKQDDVSRDVSEILDHENLDNSWRLALLERAPEYLGAIQSDGPWHGNLLSAVGNILNTTHDDDDAVRLRAAAFAALGLWGTWPDDASDEVFMDLANDPDDEQLLSYYRAFLTMAGVAEQRADAEVSAVRDGTSTPSRGRVEELRV
jgi:hypothetical protein